MTMEITQTFIDALCSCSNVDKRLEMYECVSKLIQVHLTKENTICEELQVHVALELLFRGVQDVWSRIRRVCVDAISNTLSHYQVAQNDKQIECYVFSQTVKKEISHSIDDFLNKVLHVWPHVKVWYAKEGLLQLAIGLVDLYTPYNDTRTIVLLKQMLFVIVFPSLSECQLPLREAASSLLLRISSYNSTLSNFALDYVITILKMLSVVQNTTELSKIEEEAINSNLLLKLNMQKRDNGKSSEYTTNKIDCTHVIEGYLSAFRKLTSCEKLTTTIMIDKHENTNIEMHYNLIMQYASHPASSVRQYVASILSHESPFILARLISEWIYCSRDQQEEELTQKEYCQPILHDSRLHVEWRTKETLLMALNEQICCYLRKDALSSFDWCSFWSNVQIAHELHNAKCSKNNMLARESNATSKIVDEYVATCLEYLFTASSHKQFEINRMGKQVLPCFLQWCVRYANNYKAKPQVSSEYNHSDCCNNCNGFALSGCIKNLLGTLLHCYKSRVCTAEEKEWCAECMCNVWWFAAIRCVSTNNDSNDNVEKDKHVNMKEIIQVAWEWVQQICQVAENEEHLFAPAYLILFTYILPEIHEHHDDNNVDEVNNGQEQALQLHELLLEKTCTKNMWEKLLLSSTQRTFLPVATDYVEYAILQHIPLLHIVPYWLIWLSPEHNRNVRVLPHEQCILLELIHRVVECVFEGNNGIIDSHKSKLSKLNRMFSFVYRKEFVAPSTLDGGDEVQNGYGWIKSIYATKDNIPILITNERLRGWECSNKNVDNDKLLHVIFNVISVVCNSLYCAASTESEVLNFIRDLILTLTCNKLVWRVYKKIIIHAIISRLDAVIPDWNVRSTSRTEKKESIATSDNVNEKADESKWDDWDDDDDDENQRKENNVSALSTNSEIVRAKTLIAQIEQQHSGEVFAFDNIDKNANFESTLNKKEKLNTLDSTTDNFQTKLEQLYSYVNECKLMPH